MLNRKIKKGVKLQVKLLISTLLFLSHLSCFSQIASKDTAGFKKDLKQLFAKYGIELKGYSMNVVSVNQKGGQTAFVINNNYYGDAVADSENMMYEIRTEGNKKILYVAPKKGVWTSPFLFQDSSDHSRAFLNFQGVGFIRSIDTAPLFFVNKIYLVGGGIESTPRSKVNPMKILLDGDTNKIYFFGDFDIATKRYAYKNGKIYTLKDDAFRFNPEFE